MLRTIALLRSIIGVAVLSLSCSIATAQAWPSKPIRIIVPFPAGGTMDVLARQIGNQIGPSLGQQIIVENKPGAGTIIGVDTAAKATDGHTFVVVANSFTVNPTLAPKIPYDTTKDLKPVVLIARTANVLAVHPSVPAKTVPELIEYAKKNPGKLSYASFGNGTTAHFAGEMLKLQTGIDMVHVPYKGQLPGLTDLIAGRVQVMFGNLPEFMPQIEAGKVVALATTYLKRTRYTPDIPSVSESGLPGFETDSWYGLLAPASIAPEAIARMNAEINKALTSAEFLESLTSRRLDPIGGTPDQFGDFIKKEIQKYAKIVKDAKITID